MGLRNSEMPLTNFIKKLLAYGPGDLAKACPDKAAAHYGISREHAAGYIEQQRLVRGVR